MLGTTAGKYRIVDRLGRGSMGTVYRATDETLHRDVAIKVLNADFNDPAAGRRFKAEAIAIARLNHPGIAKIYDLFEHEGQWLMAIELVQGETLENMVARTGPLSADAAAELVSQGVAALAHAHGMGVVHRDLKPANIMVAGGRLKIMDFGIARVEGSEHLTSAGLLMGTPAYMAPEQVKGHDIDARTDIFAMGCVLGFLATAKLPFKGETAMELVHSRVNDVAIPMRLLRPDLPEWFERVVAKALAVDPAHRFQTAYEFREALERGRAGLPVDTDTSAAVSPQLAETMLPGTMPVSTQTSQTAVTTPTVGVTVQSKGVTQPVASPPPPSPPPAASITPRPSSSSGLWAGIGVAVVVIAGGIWWFLLRPPATTPAVEPTPTAAPVASSTPIAPPGTTEPTPMQTAVPTATSTPTVTPSVTPSASPSPTATATPKPTPAPGADAPVSFDTIKVLHVTGRKGDVIDSSLKLGAGTIVVLPKRMNEAPTVAFAYKELVAATYVRDREPRFFANLPSPPADLTLPTTGFAGVGFRPVRNWLVLQGKARYAVVILADADAAQVLQTITERSKVKIDRPAPGK